MKKLVECVPNFSEGRNPQILDKIIDSIKAVSGVYLLGHEMDSDHNRSVVTFIGEPEAAIEAAFAAISKAKDMIDLNKHKGEHPRMGATDVCPFIPIQNITTEECVELANKLGKRVGEELNIPVFLYEDAATRPERKNLAKIRKGQFEKLRELIGTDPAKKPDYGPKAIHPTAGATAIGARFFLIAYNVNLKTTDIKLAKNIAKSIREKNGGFPGVKALGLSLTDKNMAQVSMNLTDYRKTSMLTVFNEISRQAAQAGVKVVESEVIGVLPSDALEGIAKEALKLTEFKPDQIIEHKLYQSKQDVFKSPEPFVEATASKKSTPGGGSVSALAGSLGAALGQMVFELTKNSKKYKHLAPELEPYNQKINELKQKLFHLVQKDCEAYQGFINAKKMKKETQEEKDKRKKAMLDATIKSTLVPLDIMATSLEVMKLLPIIGEKGNPNAVTDIGVGNYLSYAAIQGAMLNIRINLSMLKDEKLKEEINKESNKILQKALELKQKIEDEVNKKLD